MIATGHYIERTLTIQVIVTKTIAEIDRNFILRGTRLFPATVATKKVQVCNL